MRRLHPVLGLLGLAFVLNILLYVAQRFFGWPTNVRSIGGTVLLILGLFFASGGSGGQHLLEQAEARPIRAEDAEQYQRDRRANLGVGVRMIVVGAVTFGLAVLVP